MFLYTIAIDVLEMLPFRTGNAIHFCLKIPKLGNSNDAGWYISQPAKNGSKLCDQTRTLRYLYEQKVFFSSYLLTFKNCAHHIPKWLRLAFVGAKPSKSMER